MRRSLSVGTRWALVYTFVTTIALAIPIGFIYLSVTRQIKHDAWLLADSYGAEVRAELEDHPGMPEVAVRKFTERLRRITPELDYGVAYFAPDGTPRFQIGSLEGAEPGRLASVAASRAPAHRFRRFRTHDPAYLVATIPVRGGLVAAAVSNRTFATSVAEIRRVMFISAPIVLALSGLLGAWLARRSLRPIAQMTESARRIGGENLSERIPTRGTDDELDRLAATLNEMFDRIGDAMQRLHGFSADAAHQLKSPIASLQNEIEVTLAAEDLDESTRRLLAGFLDQVVELGSSVAAMLRLARSESGLSAGQATPVELRGLLDGVVSLFQPVAEERGVTLELNAAEPVEILGDLAWLREMFASLVQNAVVHTLQGGSVTLSLAQKPGEVVVEVADSGEGIPDSEQERIFDRFYRVSPARGVPGSGLGLALARQIAMAHGGTIDVQSRLGVGSIFTVRLSRSSRTQPGAQRAQLSASERLRA
jgi:signal transduction histidine kinase